MRLAYLVSHPIQYQVPLLRRVAREPGFEFKVFFQSDFSTKQYYDYGFNRTVQWDIPLLGGYDYEFLPAIGSSQRRSSPRTINYGLGKRLRASRFDALWVHGYSIPFNWQAMLTARALGIEVWVRDEATLVSHRRSAAKLAAKRAFMELLKLVCEKFLAIGTQNYRYYRHYHIPDERIFMMPYAVDNEFFRARAAAAVSGREKLRRSLEVDPGRPVILYAGKLCYRKNPEVLLEAYTRLSSDGQSEPQPYLLFLGEGELRPKLEARARQTGWSSIKFAGFRNQTELPRFYDLCDVLVLPSVSERFGLVINEAMNAGRAIIASDRVGCAVDLVKEGLNGFIFKAGDAADLAQALDTVLRSPEGCKTMGRQSLQLISRWSLEEDIRGLRQAAGLEDLEVGRLAQAR
jgi:glycosyltransferase involved in cell wall biosynthesis